ncbi:MAG: hypothetical protein HY765_00120, partial [Rhodomicrobium sp.]|nr:hypothetical protein [Rhodomicrobium sp.]
MRFARPLQGLLMLLLLSGPASAQFRFPDFGPAPHPTTLKWRLENPFRLFRSPADSAQLRRAYLSLAKKDRDTRPILAAEHLLQSEAGPRGWAQKIHGNTCYNERTGQYTACPDYVHPQSHSVLVKLNSAEADARCTWTLLDALKKPIRQTRSRCTNEMKFDIPYPSGGAVEVKQNATLIAKQFIQIEDLLVVGLGDSFGSGEGNPDDPVQFGDREHLNYGRVILAREGFFKWPRRLAGYPARAGNWRRIFGPLFQAAGAGWLDGSCHRSLYSYQARVALQLAAENGQRAVTFLSYACTGADTLDGIFLGSAVRECVKGKSLHLLPQLSALSRELCRTKPVEDVLSGEISKLIPELNASSPEKRKILRCPGNDFIRKPDLLLVSVGGNDIGFSEMIADAILHKKSFYRALAGEIDAIHGADRGAQKLRSLPRRYKALARAFTLYLGLPEGAQKNVLITSFPDMGYAEDGKTICNGQKGMEVFPAFQFDQGRVAKIEKLSGELYGTPREAAAVLRP